jgi:ubiquinone/menaquinone biosynthesis C-methylase UbiE
MKTQLVQIREQQREIWNRFSPGWKKWDNLSMDFLKPMGDEIIDLLKPTGVDLVLDVASGTGEPGLTIAAKLTGGVVVVTDLSAGMLEVAREKATRRGIKNIKFITGDVSKLSFPDNSFDAVSCRFGFMFFPDMLLATKEMVRVLKPGGRIAAAVWNVPEKNYWATAIMTIINKELHLEPPPKGMPGLFRCAERGMIANLFSQAGLKNIMEKEVRSILDAGNAETYWHFMTEVVAPVVSALSNADDSLKRKIKDEVFESLNHSYQNGKVAIDSSALVIYGEK